MNPEPMEGDVPVFVRLLVTAFVAIAVSQFALGLVYISVKLYLRVEHDEMKAKAQVAQIIAMNRLRALREKATERWASTTGKPRSRKRKPGFQIEKAIAYPLPCLNIASHRLIEEARGVDMTKIFKDDLQFASSEVHLRDIPFYTIWKHLEKYEPSLETCYYSGRVEVTFSNGTLTRCIIFSIQFNGSLTIPISFPRRYIQAFESPLSIATFAVRTPAPDAYIYSSNSFPTLEHFRKWVWSEKVVTDEPFRLVLALRDIYGSDELFHRTVNSQKCPLLYIEVSLEFANKRVYTRNIHFQCKPELSESSSEEELSSSESESESVSEKEVIEADESDTAKQIEPPSIELVQTSN